MSGASKSKPSQPWSDTCCVTLYFIDFAMWFRKFVGHKPTLFSKPFHQSLYTGWPFHLFKTSCWLQNKCSVLAWPCQDRPGQNIFFCFEVNSRFWTSGMVTLYFPESFGLCWSAVVVPCYWFSYQGAKTIPQSFHHLGPLVEILPNQPSL